MHPGWGPRTLEHRLGVGASFRCRAGRRERCAGTSRSSIRWTPSPRRSLAAIEQLIAEVSVRLPDRLRPRVTSDVVAERVRRHLSTGRWPFDALLPDDVVDEDKAG